MKLLTGFALFYIFALNASAESYYLKELTSGEPAYILRVHGCDLKNSRPQKRAPIKRETSYSALLLPTSSYVKILQAVNQEQVSALQSNSDLKHAKNKAHEFEESGNMPAMEHWKNKVHSLEIEIMSTLNKNRLPYYTDIYLSQENPPVYYGRSEDDKFKTNTLDELIEATDDNCIKKMS